MLSILVPFQCFNTVSWVLRRDNLACKISASAIAVGSPVEVVKKLGLLNRDQYAYLSGFFISLYFNGHFPGGPGLAGTGMSPLWILLELRVIEVISGDNWSYKTCKAPVKISSPTNQHPVFYRPDALPVAQPALSKHCRENTFHKR